MASTFHPFHSMLAASIVQIARCVIMLMLYDQVHRRLGQPRYALDPLELQHEGLSPARRTQMKHPLSEPPGVNG